MSELKDIFKELYSAQSELGQGLYAMQAAGLSNQSAWTSGQLAQMTDINNAIGAGLMSWEQAQHLLRLGGTALPVARSLESVLQKPKKSWIDLEIEALAKSVSEFKLK